MFAGKRCAFTQKSSRKHLKAKVNFCQVYQPVKGKCLSENWSFRLSRYDDVAENDTIYLSSMAYTEPPSASLQYWGKHLNWAKRVSLVVFSLSFVSIWMDYCLFIVSFSSGCLMSVHFGVQGSEASCHRHLLSPVTGVLAESQHSDQPSCFFCLKSQVWIMQTAGIGGIAVS